jgi:sn1-specific diacylglycerol lipase
MSMISKASGYAPGWMEDYGTVASALHSNYSAVRGFSTGDLTVGMTYLWDAEKQARKASQAGSAHLPYPGDCGAVHKDESDEFRRLCIAVDASYLTDRNELVDTLKTIGHEIHDSVQKSTFQEPAFFISESQARNEVFFVIRGTASMKDALTDGDCAAEDLNSTLPEFAGVKAHRGMTKSAHALLDKHASKICKCVEMFELKKKKPRFIVLGHSLGAGTAAIASILLKEKLGKTPVECVAFATPPCLDAKGCQASAHLKSIVCHDDVITRASRQNVDDLFMRIQEINWKDDFSKDVNKLHTVQAAKAASVTLASMQKSAMSAASSFAEQAKKRMASSSGGGGGNKNVEKAKAAAGAAASVAAAGAAKAAAGASALAGKFSSMMSKKAAAPEEDADDADPADLVDLFVPGKIYHFRRSPHGAGMYASVIRYDAPTLRRIELSSSYVEDHSLSEYKEALDMFSCQMNNIGKFPGGVMAPEVEGSLEIYDGYAPDYGVGSWKEAPGCFILPHELCLKRPNKDGELMPFKTELGGGGYVAEKYEFKSKGEWGIKIEVKSDDKKAKTLRLYVPGGEVEHAKWLAAIQRCCAGVCGAPAPPDVTEKEVAKPKKSFVFGGHSFF